MKQIGILLAVCSGFNLVFADIEFKKPKCDPKRKCNKPTSTSISIQCFYNCECEQIGYKLEPSSKYNTTEEEHGYTCVPCEPNFYGMNCANEHNDCKGDPCGVGQKKCETAREEVDVPRYTCECKTNFKLVDSNTNAPKCKPCGPNHYGDNCEQTYDDCSDNPCKNGATCKNLERIEKDKPAYQCICPVEFYGDKCEKTHDDCKDDPCGVGQKKCVTERKVVGVPRYTCECKTNFKLVGSDTDAPRCEACGINNFGDNCKETYQDCKPNPCNGFKCTNLVRTQKDKPNYECDCFSKSKKKGAALFQHYGKNCENKHDDCVPNPCGTPGGECIPKKRIAKNVPNYDCQCLVNEEEGYNKVDKTDSNGNKHPFCEKMNSLCGKDTCKNGGKCKWSPLTDTQTEKKVEIKS